MRVATAIHRHRSTGVAETVVSGPFSSVLWYPVAALGHSPETPTFPVSWAALSKAY